MWVSLWGEWGRVRAGEGRCRVGEAPRQPGMIGPRAAEHPWRLPPPAPLPSRSWCCTSTVLATGHEGLFKF